MSLESLNGTEYLGAHIKFRVQGFREKNDGIYYKIIAQLTLEEPFKREDFEYTYETCMQLCLILNQQCPDIPQLPGVGVFGFKPTALEAEKRRIELEKWLCAIVWRCDVLGCRQFQQFCNFHKLIDKKWLFQPVSTLKLLGQHNFPIQDFHYEPDTQVCFVLCTDDSLASKMQGFMNFFGKGKQQVHSQLFCYRLDVDVQGDPVIKELWVQSYQNRGTCLVWDEKLTLAGIGFDNGQIICLRVLTGKGYKELSEFCTIQKHTSQITGISFNCLTGHLYSISKDKNLITTDLANPNNILKGNYQFFTIKENEFQYELTCMLQYDWRLYIGDCVGNIYQFGCQSGPLQAMGQIRPDVKMSISSMQFCSNKYFLICGSHEGYYAVYEVGRAGRERQNNLITLNKTVPHDYVQVSISTKELYVNFGKNILVIDSQKMKYLFTLEAHEQNVTKIRIYEELGLMITGGKDFAVKVNLYFLIYKQKKKKKFWQYKYFPHQVMNNEMLPYRKEPIIEIKPELPKQEKLKPELEDLDHWQ